MQNKVLRERGIIIGPHTPNQKKLVLYLSSEKPSEVPESYRQLIFKYVD